MKPYKKFKIGDKVIVKKLVYSEVDSETLNRTIEEGFSRHPEVATYVGYGYKKEGTIKPEYNCQAGFKIEQSVLVAKVKFGDRGAEKITFFEFIEKVK